MGFDLLDRDPHDPEPPLRTRIARRVLGDPRKAPSRLIGLLIFVVIGLIVVGIWSVLKTESDPSGSSYWAVRALATIFNTMWVLVPVAIYLYWRYVGILRKRHSRKAAEVTGWLAESIEHLADEMRSTDGTTRVISTTDHSLDEIRANVDAGLHGEPHEGEYVDYYGRHERHADNEDVDDNLPLPAEADDPADSIEDLAARETELLVEHSRLIERIEEALGSALDADLDPTNLDTRDEFVSSYDLMDEAGQAAADEADELIEEAEAVEAELEAVQEELADRRAERDSPADTTASVDRDMPETFADTDDEDLFGVAPSTDEEKEGDTRPSFGEVWAGPDRYRDQVRAVLGHAGRLAVEWVIGAVAFLAGLVLSGWSALNRAAGGLWATVSGVFSSATRSDEESEEPSEIPDEEWEIPWKVRFAEELKHLLLDLNASLESGELMWKFGLPAMLTFIGLLLIAKLWVNPLLYLVFAAVAVLVGLFVFWLSKKRRSRRLRVHREESEWGYWSDAAGRVKTVETADVTCYMGWQSGRRYASYNRAEFIHEFSLRLYQRTHDERVSPSALEKYARNIAQMKPNLRGFLEQFEKHAIQTEIKHVVETSRDQVVDKAGLAMEVIEHPQQDKFVTTDLGHDPKLVAEEYRWMVEEGHVLSEVEVEFEDASGRTTTKTLVYPSEKTRLPDVEALHSQFSDRFTGAHGDPYYQLPECNPTEDLSGFVPSPRAAKLFGGEA